MLFHPKLKCGSKVVAVGGGGCFIAGVGWGIWYIERSIKFIYLNTKKFIIKIQINSIKLFPKNVNFLSFNIPQDGYCDKLSI